MPFVDVGDVRLFYTDEGRGDPTILLVHGWSCDSHDWTWQIPDLAARHRVIAVDNRGHGRSEVVRGGYRPRVFAADLACLIEALDAGPVVAVGHSLGGIIASALAVEHPRMVRAVVAVDPAYGVDGDAQALLGAVLAGLRGPDAVTVAAATFEGMEAPSTPAALRTWHRRRVLGTPIEVVADTLSGIYEAEDQIGLKAESERYLQGRACPVLAVHADRARAEWDAGTFVHPYSRHEAFEGCGHWLHQEQPGRFNSLLLDWVAGLPDDAGR